MKGPSGELPDGCSVKQTSSTTGSGCSRGPLEMSGDPALMVSHSPAWRKSDANLLQFPQLPHLHAKNSSPDPPKISPRAQHFPLPLVNRRLPQLPIHATISKHTALLNMCQSLYTSLLVLREISQCGNQMRKLASERWPSQTKVPQQVTGRGRV